jgi:hypothetical protein
LAATLCPPPVLGKSFRETTTKRDVDPAVKPDIWRIDMAAFKP